MKTRTLWLTASAFLLVCAGAAWLTSSVFKVSPPVTNGRPPVMPPAAPDAGKPPGEKPKPSVEIKRGVSRHWLDTLEINYKGGYLDAWIDTEIYGVRDELSLTMPHLVELPRVPEMAPKETSATAKGSVEVVILHRFGSHEGRALPELLINTQTWVTRGRGTSGTELEIRHPLPFSARIATMRGEGNMPFNPTDGAEHDRDATTFVAFKLFTYGEIGLGWPRYPEFWEGQTGSAYPRLWDSRERLLGKPAAGAAAAMIGLGGPITPALAAVAVPPTYQHLYTNGALVQVKYRFLTEREVALVQERGKRAGEDEVRAMIKGFRRMPNRIEASGGKK